MSQARNAVITDRSSLVQINRALPAGKRITDTTLVTLNRQLVGRRVTDTSLIQINRALEVQ